MKSASFVLAVCLFGIVTEACHGQIRHNGKTAPEVLQDNSLGSKMTLEQLQGTKESRRKAREEQPVWVVQPAAEPVPALKYQFHPPAWERQRTTALLHYSRALTWFLQVPAEARLRWQSDEWIEKDHPDGPSDEEFQEVVESLQNVYSELHSLAMAEDISWDHRLRDLQGRDVYAYLLADVQEIRSMARILVLRIRYQLNAGDFDGAIQSIRDGLRVSEFVRQGETLIQQLVGIACESIMRESIKEAIATPGCPNLYWALATLSRSDDGMRDSILYELTSVHRFLPALVEAETSVWTEELTSELGSPCSRSSRQ